MYRDWENLMKKIPRPPIPLSLIILYTLLHRYYLWIFMDSHHFYLGIPGDKTSYDKLMYLPNDDKQNFGSY